MDNRLKRTPGLYLTGFMGSGKTTIGRLVADRLGWDFIDLDTEIEAGEGATIAQIFELRGEAEFRRLETGMLQKVMGKIARVAPSVVALGGGTFAQPVNRDMLTGHGISVWLDCPLETIEERIGEAGLRPLARDAQQFRRLYAERRPAYEQADFRVDANCDVQQTVEAILQLSCWK